MTGIVMGILKRLGIAPAFTEDEVIDASIEDAFYDHKKTVDELLAETEGRKESNDRLRNALQIAKMRTTPFAELEHAMRRGARGNADAS